MKRKIIILAAFTGLFLVGCNNDSKKESNDLASDSAIMNNTSKISEDDVLNMISAIPNPVEMSSLLHKSGVVFSSDLLNPPDNVGKYNTNFKKALNLGIYGTDLVHMNIYDKAISSMLYLKNIKDLASDLKIEQFFDYSTLNRLSQNNKNIDSVLLITSRGFDRMNQFLQESKRTNISVLVGLGTWIESMYLASNYQKANNKEEILKRIAGQKYILEMVLQMLERYNKDENIKLLIQDLVPLKKEFDKVTTTFEYAAPTQTVQNGQKVVQDNSKSTIKITDETFKGITEAVNKIRIKVIN